MFATNCLSIKQIYKELATLCTNQNEGEIKSFLVFDNEFLSA